VRRRWRRGGGGELGDAGGDGGALAFELGEPGQDAAAVGGHGR